VFLAVKTWKDSTPVTLMLRHTPESLAKTRPLETDISPEMPPDGTAAPQWRVASRLATVNTLADKTVTAALPMVAAPADRTPVTTAALAVTVPTDTTSVTISDLKTSVPVCTSDNPPGRMAIWCELIAHATGHANDPGRVWVIDPGDVGWANKT
jgi:hypothetical protein